jgi:uncharacterized membrane protein (UPF0127 family)
LNITVNSKWICALLLFGLLFPSSLSADGFCLVRIINKENSPVYLYLEIADTEAARTKGLMHRRQLPAGQGMLFAFDYDQTLDFWMKNTYIPLSIAFIDRYGVINEIRDMRPLDTTVIRSQMPARYAVEANQGWFAAHNITKGCTIPLDGCVGK